MSDQKFIDYTQAKSIAFGDDSKAKQELSKRNDVQPEILYYLAENHEKQIREEIAKNSSTPIQAALLLSKDKEIDVRKCIAHKISELIPELSNDKQTQLNDAALQVLDILANDQAKLIRETLADAVKELKGVPKNIILKLANDVELSVSSPILKNSPILNDDDLLNIILGQPIDGAILSIASREKVSSQLVDAIVKKGNTQEIEMLLNNSGAQIKEETLDLIIEQAPHHDNWHMPIVKRPILPVKAIKKLSTFLVDTLLIELSNRSDLDSDTTVLLGKKIKEKIKEKENITKQSQLATENPKKWAKKLFKDDHLTEEAILEQLTKKNKEAVFSALALLSTIMEDNIVKIFDFGDPYLISSLSWKSGLSMRFAIQLQIQIAHISPQNILYAKDGIDYPLEKKEMEKMLKSYL